MRYIARVVAVFPEGTVYPNTFDAWDAVVRLEAQSTRRALREALSMCRSAFEHSSNLKMLGYPTKPDLYVVAGVYKEHELKNGGTSGRQCGIILTDMISLSKRDVEELRAKHDISVPLHALYVVQA